MGSKSSDAPAPDPRLVDAQINSMGVQNAAIKQMLDQAGALLPLQKEQLQFGLDTARTAYDQSQADRAYSLERRAALSGVQDKLISDATSFNAEARGDELAGKAIAGVGQQFDAAGDIAARNLARTGVNPNSGRFADMTKQLTIARALGQASAGTGARADARREGFALTDRAHNALAGYPAMSMSGTGQGAQFGASGINLVNAGGDGMAAGYGRAAQVAGQMGANATGMWNAQASYKTAQDRESGNDLGGLGSLMGGAAQLYKSGIFSDRAYKTDIRRVGTHPLGIGIYRFRYREPFASRMGPGQFVGVMADEVSTVLPEAVGRDADGHTVVNYSML